MANPSTTPPYSEAQATAWLAWLAYNMRSHDLTIFQIENLQPVWLAERKETISHLFLTRILWGVWSGLLFGLILGLLFGLISRLIEGLTGGLVEGLSVGLSVGLIGGLSLALIEIVTPIHKLDAILRAHDNSTMTLLIGTIAFGLLFGFSHMLIARFSDMHDVGLSDVLVVGLVIGLIRTSRITLREANERLCTVESLQWSWQNVRQKAREGLTFGLSVGLSGGLIIGLLIVLSSGQIEGLIGKLILRSVEGPWSGLIDGLIGGLIFGLISGPIGGLIGGFQPVAQELKTHPNQGIWLTIQASIKIGLTTGAVVGVLFGLLSRDITDGFGYGVVTFLTVGLWYGGLDVIEHSIIRLIITWQGHAPLNYARFLDYAAEELNFLQKVGGGYVFIHRYLREHFAEIAVERGYVMPPTK